MKEFYEIIAEQIGHKAFYMLGAKHKAYCNKGKYFIFQISGCRKISHIKIELAPWDLYNIVFIKCVKFESKEVKRIDGIYADQLHELIENNTGLATKLF